MKFGPRLGMLALGPALLVSMSACGGLGAASATDSAAGSGAASNVSIPQVNPDPAAVRLLPADIKQRGTITMAADLHYPPTSFLADDNKTPIGFNIDIANLLGAELGLKVQVEDVSFDTVIPGIAAGRYDFTATDMTPTAERLKVLDMITYWSDGSSLVARNGNPLGLGINDLSTCGHKIAVMVGTTQAETYLPAIAQACQAAGKQPVDQVVLPNVQGALTQLSSGRIDGVFYDTPSLAWAVQQQHQAFQLLSPQYKKQQGNDIVALGLAKNSPLTPALQAAMQALMSTPAYQDALNKWGLGAGAIPTAQLLK